jgi:DNA repair ATPase RecN
MIKKTLVFVILSVVLSSCWKNKSPEDLPRLKEAFQKQVETFEKRKTQANENVTESLESLNGLKGALETAKNEDKEFAKVYGDWEKVNKRVNSLNKEYEDLKAKAEGLFTAMETQTNSLADETSKRDLSKAISSARTKYNTTLANTSVAIGKLRALHGDAVDVVKALEVAVALNSFDNINEQLKSIEDRVDGIMDELNVAVVESKKLYEKRLDELQ